MRILSNHLDFLIGKNFSGHNRTSCFDNGLPHFGAMASINVLRERWFGGSEGGDCENTCESDYFGLRMNVELADKQDANIMSICSLLIYWKKILSETRIPTDRVEGVGGGGRQNSDFLLCFCLLRGARGPAAVEFVRIRGRRRLPTHIASDPGVAEAYGECCSPPYTSRFQHSTRQFKTGHPFTQAQVSQTN